MEKLFSLLLSFLAMYVSAQNKDSVSVLTKGYIISGELRDAGFRKIYLREISFYKEENALDSTVADKNGIFLFEGIVREPTYYEINSDGENGLYKSFILENSKIKISGNSDSIWVTGSNEEDISQELNKLSVFTQLKQLEIAYEKAEAGRDSNAIRLIQQQKQQLISKRFEGMKAFILMYPRSVVSVNLLGDFLVVDSITQAEEYLKKFEESNVSNLEQLRFFKNKIEVLKRLSIGSIAPDFILPDVNGNAVQLSGFRGSYVLLDFWASWCLPCRKENPALVRAYKQYADKKFSILSVSIDINKHDWMQAIEKDNMTWTNVSDLQYSNKSLVQGMYVASGIPDNYLIDPNGRILAKRLLGDHLIKKLDMVLGK